MGHLPIVQTLLKAGADIEAKDKRHRTPREVAMQYNRLRMLGLLGEEALVRKEAAQEPDNAKPD